MQTVEMTQRRGVGLVLVLITLGVFVTLSAFAINVAYMQLSRTELRSATDAAARAGAEALARHDSAESAVQAAIVAASKNTVAGAPLVLTAADIEIGSVARNNLNQWVFTSAGTPSSGVRVNASQTTNLLMFGVLGRQNFNPETAATAAFTENEICLVVDRSHSMCFDLTGVDWAYPAGTPVAPPDPIVHPPHATDSRWASLDAAVDVFLQSIQTTNSLQRISLVTWGSEMDTTTHEYALTNRTAAAATVNVSMGTNYAGVAQAITSLGGDLMIGGTNMSAGIALGTQTLTGSDTHSYANKTMVLMTDGKWNEGADPIETARAAKSLGITIHAVSFLDQADQTDMQAIATVSGGRFYHASDAAALQTAFQDIARNLPIVLID